MKAWVVYFGECGVLTRAETRGKARVAGLSEMCFDGNPFDPDALRETGVRRVPSADGSGPFTFANYREAKIWGDAYEGTCEECDLSDPHGIGAAGECKEEWAICYDCNRCGECGCDCA